MSEVKIPEGYKQTEIGVIPEDWEVKDLGSFMVFKNGLNKAKEFFGYGTPIVNYMDVYKSGAIQPYNIAGKVFVTSDEIRNYSAIKGDVFFTRTSETVEEIGLSSVLIDDIEDAVFSGFVLRARLKKKTLENSYMKYCFRSKSTRNQIQGTASYTTRALTNGKLLSNVLIPIPPKKEQNAIATALSDVDNLIQSLEKFIAKKEAVKTGTMQQLLTGKTRLPEFATRDDGSVKGFKQTELGRIPEDWGVDFIKNVVKITTGDKNTQDKIVTGKYPFFVRSQTIERINTYSFDGEAVLTAGDGVGTGKIYHYINGKFDYHQRVYLMYGFGDKLDGYYFYLYFSNNFYDRIMSMTAKSSVDSVRREMIADMQIALPSKPEQTAVATILSDMDTEIQVLQQRLEKTRDIKQGMMQQLLTGKVRLAH